MRRTTLGFALAGALLALSSAIIPSNQTLTAAGIDSVTADESRLIRGAACLNVTNVTTGCGQMAGCSGCSDYTGAGPCFSKAKDELRCDEDVPACGTYEQLQACRR